MVLFIFINKRGRKVFEGENVWSIR